MTVLTIAFSLIFFAIRVPYYTITELLWNGRTLAKRWIGIRVISRNGRTLTAHQVVVRNLMREVEFFTPLTYLIAGQQISWIVFWVAIGWTCILFIVPWRSKHNQRLGDMIANTAVISDEKPILVRDLTAGQAAEKAQERFVFASHHLDHYGRVELQVLEKVIRANRDTKHITEAQRRDTTEIVRRIATKISFPERIPTADQNAFLEAFYRAQRSHLESRKLFGDAREDKFFADEET